VENQAEGIPMLVSAGAHESLLGNERGASMTTPEELTSRTVRFYDRYGSELEQVKDLLAIKLRQLALAYTINNRLPPEAVTVKGRVKSMQSFLRKLERDNWPDFYYPTEVIRDLIGARIVCWFIDDCYGMLEAIKASHHFEIIENDATPIKDYNKNPQLAGYRAIHVFAEVEYDSVQKTDDQVTVQSEDIICEIQLRTKLQDAWADTTHEFFFGKAKLHGIKSDDHEGFLASLAERLEVEDRSLLRMRDAYQRMADQKQKEGKREGFKDET
jgi:putative GTP pyrophosphokinase